MMPWANGRGTTLELARADGLGGIEWRLSIASVVEDAAFSRFPGVDRVLTVLNGPGFRLVGSGFNLAALPLTPVAFPGDVAIAAVGVAAPCTDFNVMVARGVVRAEVAVGGRRSLNRGGWCFCWRWNRAVSRYPAPRMAFRRLTSCGWKAAIMPTLQCATSASGCVARGERLCSARSTPTPRRPGLDPGPRV